MVTLKPSGETTARLVVQGFTDAGLGHVRTASPTCSRRARQVFLTLCDSIRVHVHKGDVKAAFLQGDEEDWPARHAWAASARGGETR